MHFDDRLSTVLSHSANSGTLARIQFRQLVDILAQAPEALSSPLIEAGYARLDSLGKVIRTPERADLIRQSVLRLTNPRLLVQLAESDPACASAALAKTRLSEEQWLALIPGLPVHARGILRHRRDLPPRVNDLLDRLGVTDRALPPAVLPEAQDVGPVKTQATMPTQPAAKMPTQRDTEPAAKEEPVRQKAAAMALASDSRPVSTTPPPPPTTSTPSTTTPPPAPATPSLPRNEAEVEELVLTQLLGEKAPPSPEIARAGGGRSGETSPPEPEKSKRAVFAPPAAPPGPAVPTSLREWARLRAAGRMAPVPESVAKLGLNEPGIGAIVKRIEEFRAKRQKQQAPEADADSPRLPLGDTLPENAKGPATLDFQSDPSGRIVWVDGPWASAVIGFSLPFQEATPDSAQGSGTAADTAIADAVHQCLPIRAGFVTLSGAQAISGVWQVDAAAIFDSATGRFTGHCGRLRRPSQTTVRDVSNTGANAEADLMRQVLHELRTPANAIQVAAEIIQQQLYGPAPHEYRALAASIAGDCAHILAGFEELDRLVKLETGALVLEPGSANLAEVLRQTMERLGGWTGPRLSGFEASPGLAEAQLPVALDHDETERLIWRLLAALAGASATDERLAMAWSSDSERISVRLALPHLLAEREGDALFAIGETGRGGQALSAGVFGVGFTLRLAAAEANAAGGALQRLGNDLVLTLPLLQQSGYAQVAAGNA